MTHSELLVSLIDKMPKMNIFDMEILKDIIASIALKDDSIYDFYRDITTSGSFVDIASIERIAKSYSVPSMYRTHIDRRFDDFKSNIKNICIENKLIIMDGRMPGLNPDNWFKNKKPMFASTEKLTIEKAGGIRNICDKMFNIGYFDYLKILFEKSATDVSKVKYALMMKTPHKAIGGSNNGK